MDNVKQVYDIAIVGGGPAGLTAGLYARRANRSVLILEKATFGGQITFSPKVENIPGFPVLSGNEFAERLVDQVLALGAATGHPAARMRACATGWEGNRTATVSSPPVTDKGTAGVLGNTSVKGPGQKATISFWAAGGISAAIWGNISSPAMCKISGLSEGRPLAK